MSSWEDVLQRLVELETENEDLQQQLAMANDYIEHQKQQEQYR